jgi:hypothetical protein
LVKSRLPVILIGLNPYDRIVRPEEQLARITHHIKPVQSSVKRDLDALTWHDADLDLGRLANPTKPVQPTSAYRDQSIRRVFSAKGQQEDRPEARIACVDQRHRAVLA